jgi:hypothetical protein
MRSRNIIFSIAFICILSISAVILVELTFEILLNNNWLLKENLLEVFREYYACHDRKIIQYIPDCAQYDDQLSYILKPGKFRIGGREYKVDYFINSLGVRDDELSLVSPEIVVVGDSQAMGWGVEQDLVFSSLLENVLGKRVLNTGISSYGTVRELKILERINLDHLKYLIIQYNSNDYYENIEFKKNGNTLSAMSKEDYDLIAKNHKRETSYYLGKYSYYVMKYLMRSLKEDISVNNKIINVDNDSKNKDEQEAEAFLNVILNSPVNLNRCKIIVFEINGYGQNDTFFIDELNKKLVLDVSANPLVENIETIDFSSILEEDQYYILDDHINASGHAVISEVLEKHIF